MSFQSELLKHTAALNAWTCFVILIFLVIALRRLDKLYPLGDNYRFVYYSVNAWMLGWACWLILWVLANRNLLPNSLVFLSDLNTMFDVVVFLGLTQGNKYAPRDYFWTGIILVLLIGGFDALLLYFPVGEVGPTLQERFSLALSMFSPIMVGWGFRRRYGTYWVVTAGIAYAFLQPPSYEAVLHQSYSAESAAAILSILAIIKVVFAFAVLAAVGKKPKSYESLSESSIATTEINGDKWWPSLPWFSLAGGLLTVLVAVVGLKIDITAKIFAKVSSVIVILAALVVVLQYLIQFLPRTENKQKTKEDLKPVDNAPT